jgi:hypothetical protein
MVFILFKASDVRNGNCILFKLLRIVKPRALIGLLAEFSVRVVLPESTKCRTAFNCEHFYDIGRVY